MNTNITRMEYVARLKRPSNIATLRVRSATIRFAALAVISLSGCAISNSHEEISLPSPTVDLQRIADVLHVPISVERPPETTTRWYGGSQNMTVDTWQDENLQPTPELALNRALELVLNPNTRDANRIRDEAFGKKQYLSAARVDPVKCSYLRYGLIKKHGWYCKVSIKAYMWIENR